MARFQSPLDKVRVAAPCSSDWNQMVGTERVRFCAQCNLNVYNLSGMKRSEAEALISTTEGRLCVRYYRRADGSILTDNCPVGLRALKRRVSRAATATLSAVLGFFAGLGIYAGADPARSSGPDSNTMGAIAAPVDVEVTPGPEPIVGEYVQGQTVAVMGRMPARPRAETKLKVRKTGER